MPPRQTEFSRRSTSASSSISGRLSSPAQSCSRRCSALSRNTHSETASLGAVWLGHSPRINRVSACDRMRSASSTSCTDEIERVIAPPDGTALSCRPPQVYLLLPLSCGDRRTRSVKMDGGCQCGRVRYRMEGEPLGLAVCHCIECQRQSGSAFGMSLAIRRNGFRLLSGELREFTTVCDSGRMKRCTFCAKCGTRIYHQVATDALNIKAGTLDDTSWLNPSAHYWTRRKQPWVLIPEGVLCVEDDG